MRRPDFSSLCDVLKQFIRDIGVCRIPERIDIATLSNALTWVCGHSLSEGRAEFTNQYREEMHLTALVIEILGPQTRIRQARRNITIRDKLSRVDRFSTTLDKEEQAIAATLDLSSVRVAKINQGKMGNTLLVDFIESVLERRDPSNEQISAAHNAILGIRRRLLARTGKGEELRSRVSTGFGSIAKSILDAENFSDVEPLRRLGISNEMACQSVAKIAGQAKAKVKTDHQRVRAKRLIDLDDAAEAVNRRTIAEYECGSLKGSLSLITRRDMDLDGLIK